MRSFRIGSAFGIPIKLDITFLLVLPLFAWIIGSQIGQWAGILNDVWGSGLDVAALTAGSLPWVLGSVAAIGLFVGVVLHELGHSLVAIRYGYPIDSITLWILGGIAQLSDQPEDWRHELLIAIAGPVVSIVLGILSFVLLVVLPAGLDTVRFVFGYLAIVNLSLAAFNLLPGFPMDGGRVLRALLARRRPFARATQLAAEVGKAVAILMGLLGLFGGNLILIGIAFFIFIGAAGESQRTVMNAAFQGVTVEDIMTDTADLDTVDAELSVTDLVEEMFTRRHTGFPVDRDGQIVGMVTLEDAQQVDPVERDAYRVEDVMTTELHTIPRYSNAMDALDAMQQRGIGRLLVVDEAGNMVGLVSRTDLMTAFDIITSSGRTSTGVPTDTPETEPGGQSL
ncbi:MAG: site-2 protease family protein [Halanaeroarchaeum sp.]